MAREVRTDVPPVSCADGVCEVELTRGKVAIIDEADKAKVEGVFWAAISHHGNWYAMRGGIHVRGQSRLMHKVITGWEQTDHVNGNGLDNRRANLRRASRRENAANMKRRRDGSHSQYKGVSKVYETATGESRWRARIGSYNDPGGRRWLGYFTSEEEAARAYDDAARALYGEFAALNFPGPGERSAHDK